MCANQGGRSQDRVQEGLDGGSKPSSSLTQWGPTTGSNNYLEVSKLVSLALTTLASHALLALPQSRQGEALDILEHFFLWGHHPMSTLTPGVCGFPRLQDRVYTALQ